MNQKEDLKEIINNYFLMRKERIHKDIIFADGKRIECTKQIQRHNLPAGYVFFV